MDLQNTIAQREANEHLAEMGQLAPVELDKDGKPVKDTNSTEPQHEEGPQGLAELLFAGGAVLLSATAAALTGGRSSAPTAPSRSAGNTNTAQVGETPVRRREDEDDSDSAQDGDVSDSPSKNLHNDDDSGSPSLLSRAADFIGDGFNSLTSGVKSLLGINQARSILLLKAQRGVLDNEAEAKRIKDAKTQKIKEVNDSLDGLPEATKKKLQEAIKNGKNPDDIIKEAKSLKEPLKGLPDELSKRIKSAERNGSDIDYLDENGRLVMKMEAPLEDAPFTPFDLWGVGKGIQDLAKGGFKLGMAWGLGKKNPDPIHRHHLLPRQFTEYFKNAGLDIEDFKIPLPSSKHTKNPDGIHTNSGGDWNGVWRDFIEANPYADRDEILNQLNRMRDDFGI